MTKEELRVALRQTVDQWIANGATAYEPALARLAALSFPPDVGVYDDAIARAGHPPIARMYLERAMALMGDFTRQDDHLADLQRAYELAGDQKDIRSIAARTIAQHHADFLDDIDKAIPFMHEAIELNTGTSEGDAALRAFDRSLLAGWLEKRGDHVAAIAIRTDLASVGNEKSKHGQLQRIVNTHLRAGDRAAAEETLVQMTEPIESTAEAWLEFVFDESDPARIERAMNVLVRCWNDPVSRRWIQSRAHSVRSVRENLVPFFDAAFFPLADAGLAESLAIEDTLLAEPDGHLVLADELTRRGDPRGELIVVQHKLETSPDDAALVQREEELINENVFRFLGPLQTHKPRWRRGYVTHGDLHIMWDSTLGDIARVAAHPSLRFLQELRIAVATDPTNALVEAAPSLRRIEKLVTRIWTFTDDQKATVKAALPNIEFA